MRIAFALPGLHRVDRGAEIAFINVASALCEMGEEVTLFGSGPGRAGSPYRYLRASAVGRERLERFPSVPAARNETAWEELSFMPGFLRVYRPQDYDVTLTCSYPFLNWALRSRRHKGRRPAHVFVTQNGDWAPRSDDSEYRFFGCDGLVCINPDYYEANRHRYRSTLIPNGVDLGRFSPGPEERAALGLPGGVRIVLMVSALIDSKNVDVGIEAVSRLENVHLVVAGDGPLRSRIRAQADALMPGRFHNIGVAPDLMPALYRSADVFLHLSRDESFGNVYVEAMACGVQTVAWDLPRTRWITGETALLARDNDLEALVGRLSTALADPHPREATSAEAQRFSWTLIAAQYRAFFEEVLASRA